MENLNSIIEAANNGDAVSQYKLARAYENRDQCLFERQRHCRDWWVFTNCFET